MATGVEDKPGIEEIYQIAGNTSDLTVEADRRGAGDVLIAAGWSPSRLGGALSRLHTAWDGAEKPARLGKRDVERIAEKIRAQDAKDKAAAEFHGRPYAPPSPALGRAQSLAQEWYAHEVSALIGKLHALPDVYTQVAMKFARWGVQEAEHKAAGLIRWWVNQICPACDGTKLQVVDGTNRHGSKVCKLCSGAGLREVPHAQEGRRMANYLDSCVEDWSGSLRRNGAQVRRARNKVVDTPTGYVIMPTEEGTGR